MTNEVAIEILEMLKIRPRRGSSIITAQTAVNVALQTGIYALYEKKDREVWADEGVTTADDVIDKIRAEIKHFMFDVNANSSESDYACNYILNILDKYEGESEG